VNGIKENWKRWRAKVIEEAATNRASLKKLEANLRNINIRLAFDLIPVEIEKDEQQGGGTNSAIWRRIETTDSHR